MKSPVITGFGAVTPLGIGRQAFCEGLRAPVARPTGDLPETFDASKYPGVHVVEVPGFEPKRYLGDKGLRSLDRLSKLLIVAARLALDDAALKANGSWVAPSESAQRPWPDRVGMVVANAYGSLEAISELDRVALLEDPRYINPARFPLTVSNSAAGYASIWEEIRALNVTVSGGSCGALDAIACGDLLLETGRADVLLVGGAEAMTEALLVGFRRLGMQGPPRGDGPATPRRAPLGEGAALFALERSETARARKMRPLAEIGGYGTAFEPPKHGAPLVYASSEAVERAIQDALADARVEGAEIDLVVTSVAGLAPFDDAELGAIHRVVGGSVPVTAPKLDLGETFGASSAMAILAAIAHAREEAPVRTVSGKARSAIRTTLVTALGYYGSASALVMRHPSR